MAEVFGVVTGVLGLLPLCRDGLGMIKDVFDAAGTLGLAVGRLELQQDRYDEWREIWRDDNGEYDIKFEAYAKSNPAAAKRVQRQLALMTQAMFDVNALEDQYGIKADRWPDRIDAKDLGRFRLKEGENITFETQGIFLERCKLNMNFIKRCKFVFRRKEAVWNNLIDLIKEYNENLAMYGPKYELEKMFKAEFEVLRNLQLEQLRRRADAATYEANHSPPESEEKAHFQTYSLAAQFSSVVKFERQHTAYKFTMRDFRLDPSYAKILRRRADAATYEANHSPPESEEKAHFQTYSLAAQFSSVVKFERQHTAYKFTMRDFRLDPSYAVSSSAGSSTMALLFDYPVRKENAS
ncbi:uncharacterized protein PAC_14263 [Phialocephala subalpina]|uniref:Prion-inhibition and propagation HeLo domain-containing protein n=1 Tax=Phialocephala subalpina TaxID=576137 RepID=A0A1L7XH32_9HELO|nr:uncharacterized protein PAC_14263 [Phialocephala subalpina]